LVDGWNQSFYVGILTDAYCISSNASQQPICISDEATQITVLSDLTKYCTLAHVMVTCTRQQVRRSSSLSEPETTQLSLSVKQICHFNFLGILTTVTAAYC